MGEIYLSIISVELLVFCFFFFTFKYILHVALGFMWDYVFIPHDRPCGVKQIFSNSPVDELTGDSTRSSCSANCSL